MMSCVRGEECPGVEQDDDDNDNDNDRTELPIATKRELLSPAGPHLQLAATFLERAAAQTPIHGHGIVSRLISCWMPLADRQLPVPDPCMLCRLRSWGAELGEFGPARLYLGGFCCVVELRDRGDARVLHLSAECGPLAWMALRLTWVVREGFKRVCEGSREGDGYFGMSISNTVAARLAHLDRCGLSRQSKALPAGMSLKRSRPAIVIS